MLGVGVLRMEPSGMLYHIQIGWLVGRSGQLGVLEHVADWLRVVIDHITHRHHRGQLAVGHSIRQAFVQQVQKLKLL